MNQHKHHSKISVITPSFNQGFFLEKTIQSVIHQNYPNLEYIIIDGGSTDNSVDIIKKYEKHLTYWVSEKDKGQSHAFNKGLKHASGDIIGWLNSDDLYLNQCLFEASIFLQKYPKTDIVFSDYYYIDEKDKIIKRRKEIPLNYAIYLWTEDCYHANCAGFYRRKAFDAVGGLDENLHYGMDYEFYLRVAKSGIKFGHIRSYWAAYRFHGQSKSRCGSHLMKQEAQSIAANFQPAGISRHGAWIRRNVFKSLRYGWKLLIGSYLPLALFNKKDLIG